MALYKVILSYDGTEFHGSQRQAVKRTVQGVVEETLCELGWIGNSVLFAGRTDSGVHASGQVIAFRLDWKHPDGNLLRALNALLPHDVAARDISQMPESFHPRFDAIARTYHYQIDCEPLRNPLQDRYSWKVWPDIDYVLVQKTAKLIPGKKDFRAFGRPMKPGGATIREVYRAVWHKDGTRFRFEIIANAFLYHMVRHLVFTQVSVGQGKITLDEFARYLQEPNFSIAQGLAPPHGLNLKEVLYT
ncbi:MAG: tRNA pseudouridine(38-40) synthase TruA, partial [Anaerolineales bacterium]|nr:tRNA pseudouridine(38-40) synthase TruA [Anaerolineales bacterium]